MLSQLDIENIAVIERTSIEFDKGFTVLTGETGAGKSIIIDALNAVLGERTSRELIRTGCDEAKVSALFTELHQDVLKHLEKLGYPSDEEQVFIQRKLSADGKGNCRINGQIATTSILRQISRYLVDIHGQHDSQALLDPEHHYSYIDSLAENHTLFERYRGDYIEAVKIKKELDSIWRSESEKEKRLDLLRYQIDELTSADIKPGERDRLQRQRSYLQNITKLMTELQQGYVALNGSDEGVDAVSLTAAAADAVENAAAYDQTFTDTAEKLVNIHEELSEISALLRDRIEMVSSDSIKIEDVENRLDELYRLSRKYGETEEDMLAYLRKAEQELETLENAEQKIEKLQDRLQKSAEDAKKSAKLLTESRLKAGKEFEQKVCKELKYLDMPAVTFTVKFTKTALTSIGAEAIEFLISANPGEPPKPISKIASGGELSRIMLAIKNVLSHKDSIGTLIFDEIDTGISGRAAQKVGYKLRQTAQGKQVICVTHLAQIAAQADNQMLIKKEVRNGRTYTQVDTLDFEGRKQELARIIGGAQITATTLQSAGEMLTMAKGLKENE